jgi:REP element-mobilizing transposase RayT
MPHAFTDLLFHAIFSTKGRARLISDEIRADLLAYIGGVVRKIGGKAVLVNGLSDHVHMLIRLPADVPIAECLRLVKANSSKWIHEKWRKDFAWQIGYAAFTVSLSQRDRVYCYIRDQEEHHRKHSFAEEMAALLAKYGANVEDVLEDSVAPEGAEESGGTLTHS